ncbi:MAG: 16S rRNA (adenine(1518)-N(6)/adenine(1519)-N(6))-dimethyltransferase RsmA [Bacteroidales bacterium]|jgi:16S rRNA (adenine1518-N6/adenine1519-N6)-dimethyltransferase|nr:16S rRNA (adenine(1518)-N(6)/adenine(1519)-N(6))-dimethyltransferase RsmA [Bacteroidales bacterium]
MKDAKHHKGKGRACSQYGVRAKKALGQHFLKDDTIAERITSALTDYTLLKKYLPGNSIPILEIGPGTGVLTKYLLADPKINLEVAEVDDESVAFLKETFHALKDIEKKDFLTIPVDDLFGGPENSFAIIGNFPYNISSQIFFKILDYRERIPVTVCMLQKEVAERLASPPGHKAYGILSVLLQAWYDIEYLFTVEPEAFLPPPKVRSAVIRVTRNSRTSLGCNEALFKSVIKGCFLQRRKTIRNSIKPIAGNDNIKKLDGKYLDRRPEQLSVEEFAELTNSVEELSKK